MLICQFHIKIPELSKHEFQMRGQFYGETWTSTRPNFRALAKKPLFIEMKENFRK